MKMTRLITLAASILFLIAASANAGEVKHGTLTIKDAWSRATPARTGATYLTVFNDGREVDRLVGVESPVADKAELHTSSMKDGVMRMRKLDGMEVNPGEPAVLAPGGNHVMLMGLHQPLKEGQSFPVTLIFEKAGKVTVDVKVGKAGAMKPDEHDMPGMGHKHGS